MTWSSASLIRSLNSGGQGWQPAFVQRDSTSNSCYIEHYFFLFNIRITHICSVTTARCIQAYGGYYSLRYTCISDFQVSPDSVKLVLGSGDNGLHCFVENVFEKLSTKFHLNRPCFVNVMVKTFLMCLFMPHSVVSLIQVLDKKLQFLPKECTKTDHLRQSRISKILTSQNALKLTYSKVEVQKF